MTPEHKDVKLNAFRRCARLRARRRMALPAAWNCSSAAKSYWEIHIFALL